MGHRFIDSRKWGPSCDRASPAGGGGGYLDGGIGWYRKQFTVPAAAQGQRFSMLFDGAYMNSEVWLNGQHLGNHPYGYTSFSYDLTPFLNYGVPLANPHPWRPVSPSRRSNRSQGEKNPVKNV